MRWPHTTSLLSATLIACQPGGHAIRPAALASESARSAWEPNDAPRGHVTIELVAVLCPEKTVTFQMGSTSAEQAHYPPLAEDPDYDTIDERLHRVTLTVPFALGKYEVTNAQYCDVMNVALRRGMAALVSDRLTDPKGDLTYLGLAATGGDLDIQYGITVDDSRLRPKPGLESHPVHLVSWYGAVVFCNVLSEMHGLTPAYDLEDWSWKAEADGYRLPTEAEWEYAARGSGQAAFAWGDDIDPSCTNYGPSARRFGTITMPSGYYDGTMRDGTATKSNASPFGLFDMTGNVWEWCWDWYGRRFYADGAVDPHKGVWRVG